MEKTYYYEESSGFLETPADKIDEALQYARKNNIHSVHIGVNITNINYKLDLSPLSGDDNIYNVSIHENLKLDNINCNPLYTMQNLRQLSIPYVKCDIDFSKLTNLESLHIIGSDREIPKLKTLKLNHLLLRKIKNKNCHFLSALQDLKILRIIMGSIQNLDGIESLQKIEYMKLAYCRNLTDISAITTLNKLNRLHIEKCQQVTDFSILKQNKTITQMFLS